MTPRIRQSFLIALLVALYLLVALPLPYLLVDHYAAMLAGDADHSDVDIHVWLEWAAGSSLSSGQIVFAVSQLFVGPATVPQFRIPSVPLIVSIWPRGPPFC